MGKDEVMAIFAAWDGLSSQSLLDQYGVELNQVRYVRRSLASIHIELVDDFVLDTAPDEGWDADGEFPHFACANSVDLRHGDVKACDSLCFGLLGDEDVGSSDRIAGVFVVGFPLLFKDFRIRVIDLAIVPTILDGKDGADR